MTIRRLPRPRDSTSLASLASDPGSAERHWLYCADQLADRGLVVRHNPEPPFTPRAWHTAATGRAFSYSPGLGAGK